MQIKMHEAQKVVRFIEEIEDSPFGQDDIDLIGANTKLSKEPSEEGIKSTN